MITKAKLKKMRMKKSEEFFEQEPEYEDFTDEAVTEEAEPIEPEQEQINPPTNEAEDQVTPLQQIRRLAGEKVDIKEENKIHPKKKLQWVSQEMMPVVAILYDIYEKLDEISKKK